MPVEVFRSKLISNGFNPEDVDFSMLEVLQYKKPESLNNTDFRILSYILQKRKSKSVIESVPISEAKQNYYFDA